MYTYNYRLFDRYNRHAASFAVLDWVMIIPKEVEPLFNEQLEKFEKEKKMYYITQMQRPSYEKGKKEGVSKMLSRQIAKKFDSQVRRESPRLRNLRSDDLMELAEELFILNSLTDVHNWINERKKLNKQNA